VGRSAKPSVAALFCIVTLTLFSCSAFGADLAVLTNGFSIRHEHRLVMGETTRLYLSADDSSFMDVPTAEIAGYERDLAPPAPGDAYASLPTPFASAKAESSQAQSVKPQSGKSAPALSEVVNTASAAYHLDPDLVNSVIHAESGFNSHAVSPKGARGLMQLMPGTASQLGVNDVFDAQANVEGGSRYLRELLERYNFDLIKALAAYNAGPERVEKYRGVPPFRETRAYVARIVHEYNTKKIAQEKEAKRKQILAKQISAKATIKTQGSTPTVVRASSKPATIAAEAAH
jgi:hypothetical protein